MASTTFEQAKECPRCGKPGEDRQTIPVKSNDVPRGTTVHMIYCTTELCPWYDTSWAVQVNPDGSIPQAGSSLRTEKQFPSRNRGMSVRERAEKTREGIRKSGY